MFQYIVLALALSQAGMAAPRHLVFKRQVPTVAGVAAPTGVAPIGVVSSTTSAAAAPSSTGGSTGGSSTPSTAYKTFTGDGSPAAGWPTDADLVDFNTLWSVNQAIIAASCENNFGLANNSPAETAALQSAIQSQASSAGVDPRLVLAMVMQESKGCVRVPTTSVGHPNPGLMQDDNGPNTCNSGTPTNPCPDSTITGMISDGLTFGTSSLGACVKAALNPGTAQGLFQAAFLYNGDITDSQTSLTGTTPCYASDVANRLTGWVDTDGPNTCGS